MVDSPPTTSPGMAHATQTASRPVVVNGNGAAAGTDRLWAQYRPRGAPRLPPLGVNHTSPPNLGPVGGVPSHSSQKRPSPSNAGESEKEDMDDDGDESSSRAGLGSSFSLSGIGKDDDSFTSHREKRRVIEKKSRMRRVDALDHLRLVVSREFQYQHQRAHASAAGGGGGGSLAIGLPAGLSNIDPLTQAPRKNCQADICFEAVEIIEKLRGENDRLRHQNRELIERLQSGQIQSGSHGPSMSSRAT